jgi:hypothetical protein
MDSGTDAGMDASRDAGLDATTPPDGSTDSASTPDAMTDTGVDSGMDGGPPCAQPSATSYCTALPSLPTAPTIDGMLECGLTLQPVPVRHWTGTSTYPADNSASMAWAWRPDGLYVFVDVNDPSRLPALAAQDPYYGDSVEVYVDSDGAYPTSPMYDNPGAMQLIAAAPENDTTMVTRGQRWRTAVFVGAWLGSQYAAFPKPGGYVLEAFVPAVDLDLASWTLAAGQRVGTDLSINVSVSAEPPPVGETANVGRRLGQYFMNVPDPDCADSSCLPFGNVTGFCSPVLE